MRRYHYLLSLFFTLFSLLGTSQAYIFETVEKSENDNDITLIMKPKYPSETLQLHLGGYLQEDINDITIMTEVGLNIKRWESVQSKDIVLDLTELDRQKPYLLHLKTSSGEVLIERFIRV